MQSQSRGCLEFRNDHAKLLSICLSLSLFPFHDGRVQVQSQLQLANLKVIGVTLVTGILRDPCLFKNDYSAWVVASISWSLIVWPKN